MEAIDFDNSANNFWDGSGTKVPLGWCVVRDIIIY